MIDVKKLITGFLILATVAVASGLTLSLVSSWQPAGDASSGTDASSSGITIDAGGAGSAAPAYAFVDTGSLQGNAAEVLSQTETTSTAAIINDPNNLTNIFATSFVNNLETANPNGITTNSSGTPVIVTPDAQTLAQDVASNPVTASITIPNWDLEVQSQLFKITTSSTPGAIAQYGSALNTLMMNSFIASGLESEVSNPNNADLSGVANVISETQGVIAGTLALQVPQKFVPFQESLLRVMIYEKNFAQLAENANTDPVKTSLIFDGEQQKFSAALTDLQQQMQNASSLGLSFNNAPSSSVPLIALVLGIQPAHAQWTVVDWVSYAQTIWKYLKGVLLQTLKNALISIIQQRILIAVQGAHGVPNFVTDFGAEMISSYESKAFNVINNGIAAAPSYQASVLGSMLSTAYQSPNTVGDMTPQLVSSDPGFQKYITSTSTSSSTADFKHYLSIFGNGGNIWSNAMTIQQAAQTAGSNAEQANQTQNVAQQGFKGGGVCDDQSNPNGVTQLCKTPQGQYYSPSDTLFSSTGKCNSGDTPVSVPNGGMCADGTAPKVTSPGQTTAQLLSSGIKSGLSNIVNGSDIVGLVESLSTSLINNLATQAITFASTAGSAGSGYSGNPGLGGISAGSIGSSSSTSAANSPIQCLPSSQPVTISTSTGYALASVSAIGGSVNTTCMANNNCPSTINSDGTPIYNWTAQGSQQAGSSTALTGSSLQLTYTTPGTYTATVTASTDGTTASCQINVGN